jgi:hypothetical protein
MLGLPSRPVTFGLGEHDRFDSLEVTWPGGGKQPVAPDRVRVDALTVIEEEP